MHRAVTITLGRPNVDSKRDIKGEFDDEEWSTLLKYVEYADDLSNIELVRKGGPGKLSVNYDQNKGFSFSVDLPPEDHILALLHRLRPFVLTEEPTNFYRACSILGRAFQDDDFRKFLKSLRAYYQGQHMRDLILIKSNDVLINSEKTLQKWLNAHEYHKDRDKQKEIELLHKILPLEASRAIFIMMLYDKLRAIMVVANLIEVLAGKQKIFSCKLE